jgi:hypothetical protein
MNEAPLQHLTDALLKIIRAATTRIVDIAEQNDGVVDAQAVAVWRDNVAAAIVEYHTAAMIAGSDGKPLNPGMQGQLSEIVAAQLNYLENFAKEVAAGKISPAQISARADMYAPAIRQPYSAGFTGGLPLPAMPAEGTICHTNCKCSWDIVPIDEEAGDYDAFWRRAADDSCSTCIARAREWSPILIRGLTLQ